MHAMARMKSRTMSDTWAFTILRHTPITTAPRKKPMPLAASRNRTRNRLTLSVTARSWMVGPNMAKYMPAPKKLKWMTSVCAVLTSLSRRLACRCDCLTCADSRMCSSADFRRKACVSGGLFVMSVTSATVADLRGTCGVVTVGDGAMVCGGGPSVTIGIVSGPSSLASARSFCLRGGENNGGRGKTGEGSICIAGVKSAAFLADVDCFDAFLCVGGGESVPDAGLLSPGDVGSDLVTVDEPESGEKC